MNLRFRKQENETDEEFVVRISVGIDNASILHNMVLEESVWSRSGNSCWCFMSERKGA